MFKNKSHWLIFSFIAAAESIAALIWLGAIPRDPEASFLFGFSFQRVLLALVPTSLVLIFAMVMGGLISHGRLSDFITHLLTSLADRPLLSEVVLWLAALSGVLIFNGQLLIKAEVIQRLRPALCLLSLVLFEAALALRISSQKHSIKGWLPFGIFAGWIALLVLAGGLAGMGDVVQANLYLGANMPMLATQVLVAVFIALTLHILLSHLRPGFSQKIGVDFVIGLGIFVLAAGLWLHAPIPLTHFTRSANFPGSEAIFPVSDSRTYDANALQWVLGYGLSGGNPLPRPFYSFFLGLLHVLFGSDLHNLINAQTFFLAFLPVGVYWLGRRLFNATAGGLAAVLVIFREYNQALMSSTYTLSSVRMLLSETFTACFLVCLVLVAVRWLQKPQSRTLALWSGIVLGLTVLVRTQVLLLAAVILLFAFIALLRALRAPLRKPRTLRALLLPSTWLLLGLLLVILPWMGRNYLRTGAFVLEDPSYTARTLLSVEGERVSSEGMAQSMLANPLSFVRRTVSLFSNSTLSSLYQLPWNWNWNLGLEEVTANHLETPFYPFLNLKPGQIGWLSLHLLIIAAGLAAAWKKLNLAGLLPMGIYLGYNLSAALVGFSGWRYVQPVDWIILLYWAMGAWVGIQWLLNRTEESQTGQQSPQKEWKPAVLILSALALGLVLPVGELLYPGHAPAVDRPALIQELGPIAPPEILLLANDPHTVLLSGRAFYPIYLNSPKNFANLNLTVKTHSGNQKGVYFSVLNADKSSVLLLLAALPTVIPHDLPVIVIGCRKDSLIEAYAVVVGGKTTQLILSDQPIPAQCEP